MSNSLISEAIVPVLSAAIGAGIGGWIAFLIAKHRFSLENRDEGRAGLNTMLFWLSEICEKCSSTAERLKIQPENDGEWGDFLRCIKGKHTEVDELLRTMGIAKQQWESHQEHILRLAMTDINKDKDRCEDFKKIYKKINKLIWDTELYAKIFNEMTGVIKFDSDNQPEKSTMEAVHKHDFWGKISNAKTKLDDISKDCKEISEDINSALTAMKC